MGEVTGHNLATLVKTLVIFGTIACIILVYMWVEETLPRFRYDQLMDLGWKGLIPLAVVNMIITAAAELSNQPLLVNWVGLGVFIALLYAGSALMKSKKTSV
jgi:NADH-quinone oxidoreductase subunit H